jgi:O-antigen ligase
MGIRQFVAIGAVDWAIIHSSQSGILPFRATGSAVIRAFSPLPGPFHFGLLMMMGLTLVFARSMERARVGAILAALVMVPALAMNATRLNWMGTAAALAVAALAALRGDRAFRLLGRLCMAAAVAVAVLWQVIQSAAFASLARFSQTIMNPTSESSYVLRVQGWLTDIFPAIGRHPWLGYGTGMAKDGSGVYTSHNILLKVLIEGGVVLLVPYLLGLVACGVALWRRRDVPEARAAFALILGVHTGGMLGPLLDAFPANVFFWLLLGAGLAAPRRSGDAR